MSAGITAHGEKLKDVAAGTDPTDAVIRGQLVTGSAGPLVGDGIGAQVVVVYTGFKPGSTITATCNDAAAAPVGGISIDKSVPGQFTIQSNNVADAGRSFDFFGIL